MIEGWLREAVKACGLPSSPTLGDLRDQVRMSLPLTLVKRPRLTCGLARDWLDSMGRAHGGLPRTDRRLHGCMVAHGGGGILFYDSQDDELQQRFTLAHEVAHFVLDHHLPRARALRSFGETILPVLDGKRPPAPHESLFLMLERIPTGVQVRRMERNDSGEPCTGREMEAELHADRLAFELLAPAREALPLLRRASRQEAAAELASRFGLPEREARAYARLLMAREPARRSFFVNLVPVEECSHE
ncbi:ImmA/IrrE family metallo-endopeptidase [Archangium violaceum]|uniref:ImmA/IrrE family metallo-endopeptidase n=1 Tax=Archangium violaceum TaxID=83451 RepID=UPI001950A5A3|nr:ImmA/IrrE family metallo-endopeptidase [Archangium violaceum]QRN97340.1 ImmA/IrrE family metallo-endopeptidase [Archangium violaceum]